MWGKNLKVFCILSSTYTFFRPINHNKMLHFWSKLLGLFHVPTYVFPNIFFLYKLLFYFFLIILFIAHVLHSRVFNIILLLLLTINDFLHYIRLLFTLPQYMHPLYTKCGIKWILFNNSLFRCFIIMIDTY